MILMPRFPTCGTQFICFNSYKYEERADVLFDADGQTAKSRSRKYYRLTTSKVMLLSFLDNPNPYSKEKKCLSAVTAMCKVASQSAESRPLTVSIEIP